MKAPEEIVQAIGELLSALLGTLERVAWVGRHLHPTRGLALSEELAPAADVLTAAVQAVDLPECPPELQFIRDRLAEVARQTVALATAFIEGARGSGDPLALYRALRRLAPVQEALYPLAPVLDAVSRYFLEPARRDDDALIARLREAAMRDDEPRAGVLHAKNDRDTRGGFSVYVPEASASGDPRPLIVALHGGHGHGRDFLWTWLSEARSRGMLVIAPTSAGRTWSIMGDDVDAARVTEIVEFVATRYPVDRRRVLLTGCRTARPMRSCAACATARRSRTWRPRAACCTPC